MRTPRSEESRKAIVGFAILATGTALFALFFLGIIPRLISGGGRTVTANFASTGSLHKGEPVRIDGVNVGTVKKISVHPGGEGATVKMSIKKSAGSLYRDASASIRWRTLLGASFAVALQRGTPGTGNLGSQIIPEQRTSYQAELDDLTGTLVPNAQAGLQDTFRELPKTFSDPDEPASVLKTLAKQAPSIASGFGALRGQAKGSDLANLVRYTGAAMNELDAPQDALHSLVQNTAVTTATMAAHAGDLQDTFDVAAQALPRVRSTLGLLDNTLDDANPLITRLEDPGAKIRPAIAALRPVVTGADHLLSDKAEPLLTSLRPTAGALEKVADQGVPLLDQLAPSLQSINDHALPDLAKMSPESKHRTYEMIGPAIAGLDGVGSHYDSESSYIRFTGNGGGRIIDSLPCRAYFTDSDSKSFLQCQAMSMLLEKVFIGPGGN